MTPLADASANKTDVSLDASAESADPEPPCFARALVSPELTEDVDLTETPDEHSPPESRLLLAVGVPFTRDLDLRELAGETGMLP